MTKPKTVKIGTYLTPAVAEQLKALSERTRVPMAAYVQEAIEDLLKKYAPPSQGGRSKRSSE